MSKTMAVTLTNTSLASSSSLSKRQNGNGSLDAAVTVIKPSKRRNNTEPFRNERYWFEDGSAVLQVDNTLYNVYRGILKQHSSYFRTKLGSIPVPKEGRFATIGPGSLTEPLVLKVAKSDFEVFLSYLHPEKYDSKNEFTLDEWWVIAKVATKLDFETIRTNAIAAMLGKADAFDLIEFGRENDIQECCKEGFRLLVLREQPLSREEGERLGMTSVIVITNARDMLAKGTKWRELEFSFHLGTAE